MSRSPRRLLVLNGSSPQEAVQPYGAQHLRDHGFTFVPLRYGWVPRRILDVVYHRSDVHLGAPAPVAVWRADAVLAYLEPNIHYPAVMKRVPGPFRRIPLVSLVCWAAEDLRGGDARRRARVLRLLRSSDLVLYFSENQTETFVEAGIARERLRVVPFGIDLNAVGGGRVEGERSIDVLSVGGDRGRDFATLVEAARGTDFQVRIVTDDARAAGLDPPPNVRIEGRVPEAEYFAMLRRSRVVVVPTHELAYPTGQSVALQAAAAGCAVVVSSTPAMSDYFEHGVTAEMPPVGDVTALRAALARLRDDGYRRELAARGQAHVRARHGEVNLWAAVADAVRERWPLDSGPRPG